MVSQIKDVLVSLKSTVAAATKLVVDIEKPLPSGIRLEAYAETAAGNVSVRVKDARAFFKFTQSYSSPSEWNRMKITLDEKNAVVVKTDFDAELQKKTENRVK